MPKHYQHEVPEAMGAVNDLSIKRAILERQSRGGKGVDLDVLQIAATGTIPPSAGEDPEPQRWASALLFMIAKGAERGLVADLVDSELSCVTTAARTAWPRLLGRAVAMQLSVGRDSVPSGLQGFKLEEAMKLTSTQAGWRELELGHIYRMVKCAFNSAGSSELPHAIPGTVHNPQSRCSRSSPRTPHWRSSRGPPGWDRIGAPVLRLW